MGKKRINLTNLENIKTQLIRYQNTVCQKDLEKQGILFIINAERARNTSLSFYFKSLEIVTFCVTIISFTTWQQSIVIANYIPDTLNE